MKNSLYLILHGRFPSEKAMALWVAKGAEAFARTGTRTILLTAGSGLNKGDPFKYYDIERNFDIEYLPTINLFFIVIGFNWLH